MRGVMASGGVGDLIMALPLIEKLRESLGRFTLHTNHPDVYEFYTGKQSKLLDFENLTHPLQRWDYLIHVTNFAWFLRAKQKGIHFPLYCFNQNFISQHGMKHFIDHHPHYDGEAADMLIQKGFNRRNLSQAMLGYEPLPHVKKAVKALKFWHKNYITVHWGVGDNHAGKVTRPTKTWDLNHYRELILLLKKKYPKLGIVQLGSGLTGQKIEGVDACFFNLSISDSFKILAGSKLHIDGDSGLVHAATTFGVKCIVLFGPTPAAYFGYQENINLAFPMSCSPCWWSTDTWVAQCPRNYKAPLCMNMIFPAKVFEEVQKALEAKPL